MEAMSLSVRVDAGVIGHNNRSFVAKNVNADKISDNIIYVQKDLKETYKEIFSEALEKYNTKQTRSDRIIKDYYEHIKNGNQEKLFYEAVMLCLTSSLPQQKKPPISLTSKVLMK